MGSTFERRFFSPAEWHATLVYLHERVSEHRDDSDPAEDLDFHSFSREFGAIRRELIRSIRAGSYRAQPAERLLLIADKEREIFRFKLIDRFVLVHFARLLQEQTSAGLSDRLYSFRPGRSDRQALERAADFIARHQATLYVARRDIKSYGETLDHALLAEDFRRFTAAGATLRELFARMCRFEYHGEHGPVSNLKGLPTGSYLQIVFENLYLSGLDERLSPLEDCLYLRFGDDILFISPDRERFEHGRALMAAEVAARRLAFNPAKCADFALVAPHRIAEQRREHPDLAACAIFSYLGMNLSYRATVTATAAKRARIRLFLKQRIQSCARQLSWKADSETRVRVICRALSTLFEAHREGLDSPLRAYAGKLREEESLRDLDRWLALEVLRAGLGRGAKRGAFRHFPPRRLREFGLPSLVHLRRTHAF